MNVVVQLAVLFTFNHQANITKLSFGITWNLTPAKIISRKYVKADIETSLRIPDFESSNNSNIFCLYHYINNSHELTALVVIEEIFMQIIQLEAVFPSSMHAL